MGVVEKVVKRADELQVLVFGVIDFSVVVFPDDFLFDEFDHIIVVMDHSFGVYWVYGGKDRERVC